MDHNSNSIAANYPDEVVLASWMQRVGAYLIEGCILIPIFCVFGLMLNYVNYPIAMMLALCAVGVPVYWHYLNGVTGQSPGKAIVGLKVVHSTTLEPVGGPLGLVRLLVACVISGFTCGLGNLLDCLFPLWDTRKQTLHDKAVDTIVIANQPPIPLWNALFGSNQTSPSSTTSSNAARALFKPAALSGSLGLLSAGNQTDTPTNSKLLNAQYPLVGIIFASGLHLLAALTYKAQYGEYLRGWADPLLPLVSATMAIAALQTGKTIWTWAAVGGGLAQSSFGLFRVIGLFSAIDGAVLFTAVVDLLLVGAIVIFTVGNVLSNEILGAQSLLGALALFVALFGSAVTLFGIWDTFTAFDYEETLLESLLSTLGAWVSLYLIGLMFSVSCFYGRDRTAPVGALVWAICTLISLVSWSFMPIHNTLYNESIGLVPLLMVATLFGLGGLAAAGLWKGLQAGAEAPAPPVLQDSHQSNATVATPSLPEETTVQQLAPDQTVIRGRIGVDIPKPHHLTLDTGQVVAVAGPTVLGRDPQLLPERQASATAALEDTSSTVSKSHAIITMSDDRFTIEDLNSANGTVVTTPDGRRIFLDPGHPMEFTRGAMVELGDRTLFTSR